MNKMGFEKDDLIPLAGLRECPVKITLHTDLQIEMIKKTARTEPDSIPPIDVAELPDEKTLVIVDGHARAQALRSFGIDKIRAKLHNVQNITEAVILHVRLNQRNQINPLKFYDAYEFLKENGCDSKEIPKKLWLNESYSKLFKINLTEEAHVLLERYLDELASKYSIVHLPVYVIEAIGKIKDEQDQVESVKMMIQMIPPNTPESKISFPSFDQLEIAFSSFRKVGKEREPIIFSLNDDAKPSANKSAVSKKNQQDEQAVRRVHSKEEIDEAKEIISNVPNRALLKCPHGTKFLVDTKNHTISEIKEDDTVISISGDSSEPVFMIPSEHAKFLQLNFGDPVYFKSFSTHKQLQKFIDNLEGQNQRIVVITSQKI
ncbi:ParB-like nuclease domain protein [Marine Group I thaumarchaeote SCGC AAA799-E16]|uniref:ParB-like nuclease domain protein n=1 Tax=Marine Group I thaumarchaeote SCGC AAA799-E16 TaxID=1502292 RepID=A0A081S4C0_9ARCH|nr:ParB-like nuclease domain protein [Marine Group I thaumarchaeote SCGC AAA799-E16]